MNNVEKPIDLESDLFNYYAENERAISWESVTTEDNKLLNIYVVFESNQGSLDELQEIASKHGAQVNHVRGKKEILDEVFDKYDAPRLIDEGVYYEVFTITPDIGAKEQEIRQTILNMAVKKAVEDIQS